MRTMIGGWAMVSMFLMSNIGQANTSPVDFAADSSVVEPAAVSPRERAQVGLCSLVEQVESARREAERVTAGGWGRSVGDQIQARFGLMDGVEMDCHGVLSGLSNDAVGASAVRLEQATDGLSGRVVLYADAWKTPVVTLAWEADGSGIAYRMLRPDGSGERGYVADSGAGRFMTVADGRIVFAASWTADGAGQWAARRYEHPASRSYHNGHWAAPVLPSLASRQPMAR